MNPSVVGSIATRLVELNALRKKRPPQMTPQTRSLIERFALNSHLPDPLRTAHLIAGVLARGEIRHRA
jgi:hypothetical protein